MELKATLKISL